MAHIRPYKERWRAEVQKHGQRATKVFATKREAQAWAMRQEAEFEAFAAGGGRTFAALASEYAARVTSRKKSVRWEENAIARLCEQIGADTPLSAIDSARIARWRDARLTSVSGSTVQREANMLRNMLRVARDEWRWGVGDAFRGVRLPKHNPARQAMWRWPLIKRVLRAPRTGKTAEMQAAFRISLHTGMRLSEVLTGRFDPARKVMVLADSKTGAAMVPLPRRALKLLPAQFTASANEGSTLFSRLCRELLIEGLTFHDARASALTWLARRVDVMTLARISRHRDVSLLANVYYRESAEQIAARI